MSIWVAATESLMLGLTLQLLVLGHPERRDVLQFLWDMKARNSASEKDPVAVRRGAGYHVAGFSFPTRHLHVLTCTLMPEGSGAGAPAVASPPPPSADMLGVRAASRYSWCLRCIACPLPRATVHHLPTVQDTDTR